MISLILTGLAGIVCGVVIMRVMSSGNSTPKVDLASAEGELNQVVPAEKVRSVTTNQMLAGAGGIVAIAVAIIAFRGNDNATASAPDSASTVASAMPNAKSLDDVDTMIGKLRERLKANPADGEGFRMLGWSLVNTGKPEEAVEPYKKAMALLPVRADILAGYGEALTGAAKGSVTEEAKSIFDRALKLDPKEFRARFFDGLYKSQHGQEQVALDQWVAVANDAPVDASWQPDLRQRISALSAKLKVDVSGRLKVGTSSNSPAPSAPALDSSTVQNANAMPAADRQAMIDGMVAGLVKKLEAKPNDPDGWALLLRSRMVLGQPEQAGTDLNAAKKALAGNTQGLALVSAAAKDLKVPGAQ